MIEIIENRYGKSRVRLVKVTRHKGHHDLYEWTVEVLLEGDFDTSYSEGDNSKILTTDTMKNTVYSLARTSKATSIESFARELADFLLTRNPQVSATLIKVESAMWKRLTIDGQPHPDSFMRGSAERQVTRLRVARDTHMITSGFEELVVMKTAKSGFSSFLRDSLTTLPETNYRLLGTAVTAHWTYTQATLTDPTTNFNHLRQNIRESMLHAFAAHESLSVQHTLYAMAETALTNQAIDEVHMIMPNKHCLLVDLNRFGQDNPNEIFVPTDEPHGTIEARLGRSA